MMLRPRWPSAGPIGGDGLALPAGTCSFTKPTIFFAMSWLLLLSSASARSPRRPPWPPPYWSSSRRHRCLQFLHLAELELDRGGPAEDRDRDAQAALLVVHVFHIAVEVGERAFAHPHHLADFEERLRLRLLDAFSHLAHDLVDLLLGDRRRPVARAAHETGHLVGVLHQVPGVVVHFHFDQHVAGEEAALTDGALPVLHLHDFLGRHEDAAELVLHAGALDALLQGPADALLHARIGMDHIP